MTNQWYCYRETIHGATNAMMEPMEAYMNEHSAVMNRMFQPSRQSAHVQRSWPPRPRSNDDFIASVQTATSRVSSPCAHLAQLLLPSQ